MARNFHRKNRLSAVTEINVTPLIDLAFAWLIIFMITAPLLEQTIPLNLPLESQREQTSREEIDFQVISVRKDGSYFWGETPVEWSELVRLIEDLGKESNPPVINLRADGAVNYQQVISVVDELKKNKLEKLSLDTQVKG